MASLGVRCECSMIRSDVPSRQIDHQNPSKPCSLTTPKRTGSKNQTGHAISASMPALGYGSIPRKPKPYQEFDEGTAIAHEKLDNWMEGSVVEIVRNLREAPLFVHVYDGDSGRDGGLDGESIRLRTEKRVTEEDWDCVKMKWEKGEVRKPEGVIYVEELEDGDNEQDNVNKIWGLVVQGKGANCRPACYLLETCMVGSGLGSFSTHFCMMKVKSFRESARSQLMKSWLQQGQRGSQITMG